MFARWGRFVYRFRWATLVASGMVLGISIAGLLMGGTLTSGGPLTSDLEAARAGNLVSKELGSGATTTSNFVLLFSSPTLLARTCRRTHCPALGRGPMYA